MGQPREWAEKDSKERSIRKKSILTGCRSEIQVEPMLQGRIIKPAAGILVKQSARVIERWKVDAAADLLRGAGEVHEDDQAADCHRKQGISDRPSKGEQIN
jgi:hypothetical protein